MCGRGASVYDRESVARFVLAEEVQAPELPLSWNVAPTQDVYVAATNTSGARKLRALRWGLVPHWAKDPRAAARLINARAETLAQRPAYRGLLGSHRGLAVFSGFYEWWRPHTGVKAGKQPYYFRLVSGEPLAIAALWDTWHDTEGRVLRTVSLITSAANETMAPVHDRMPVVLAPDAWDEWLAPGPIRAPRLARLLSPAPNDRLACWPVSSAVNSPKNNGPQLVEPICLGGPPPG